MTTRGRLYFAGSPDGTTAVTVALDKPSPENLALLKANLTQRGFVSVAFRGATVVFAITAPPSNMGAALDAIGESLGGTAYRLTVSGYQGQAPTGGTASERLDFEVGSKSAWEMRDDDLYGVNDDTECG